MKKIFCIDKELFKVTSSAGTVTLFAFLIPMLFENVMSVFHSTASAAILSFYSENAVAAVGAANGIINIATLFFSAVSMGATVLISTAIGAGKMKKSRELSFSALLAAIIIALVITPVLICMSDSLVGSLNLTGEVFTQAKLYLNVRMGFIVFNAISAVALGILRCYGYPKYTFIVMTAVNIIHILICAVVVFLPEIVPLKGVCGVAVAGALSTFAGTVITIVLLVRLKIQIVRPHSRKRLLKHIGNILKIGIPSVISGASFTVSQTIATSYVALIGDYALSAKVYFSNILSYVYLFSLCAGSANALLVGRCYGGGDMEKADKMNRQLIKLTGGVNFIMSVIVILLRRQLIGIFTDNELIINISTVIFCVDVITEQARAVSHVYEYSLRAIGDVLYSTVVLIISCWAFSVGFSYLLAIKYGIGLLGCWIGLAIDEIIRAGVTYFRWKKIYRRKYDK